MVDMPRFKLEGKKGVLVEDYVFDDTPFVGHSINVGNIVLTHHGVLYIKHGYVWDFGTGAVDTPSMVYASLGHDAMCDLNNAGLLKGTDITQRRIDRWFLSLLKEAGMGWFRRAYVYLAVRGFQIVTG